MATRQLDRGDVLAGGMLRALCETLPCLQVAACERGRWCCELQVQLKEAVEIERFSPPVLLLLQLRSKRAHLPKQGWDASRTS